MIAPAVLSPRATRTRTAILEAAEELFAARGLAEARLEDVALAVGIRRASIIYYFKDKAQLYDAVLGNALGDLFRQIEKALSGEDDLRVRMENAIAVWTDYIAGRPTAARLLLREMVGATPDQPPRMLRHVRPFLEMFRKVASEHRGPRVVSDTLSPIHFASAIAGTTLFMVGALPALHPDLDFNPLEPEQLKAQREVVLRIASRLLESRQDGSNDPASGIRT